MSHSRPNTESDDQLLGEHNKAGSVRLIVHGILWEDQWRQASCKRVGGCVCSNASKTSQAYSVSGQKIFFPSKNIPEKSKGFFEGAATNDGRYASAYPQILRNQQHHQVTQRNIKRIAHNLWEAQKLYAKLINARVRPIP